MNEEKEPLHGHGANSVERVSRLVPYDSVPTPFS